MKAIVILRKLKDWRKGLLENVIKGLEKQDISVEVQRINYLKYDQTDIAIQWYLKKPYQTILLNFMKHGKMLPIGMEVGWFDREEHFLLHNEDGKRYPATKKGSYKKFFKKIPDYKNKVWLIVGQAKGDFNLRNCKNYDKWIEDIFKKLNCWGKLPVVYRPHPRGHENPPDRPLHEDLGRAFGIVTWNSSTVLKAMMHRIPVCVYDFPELEDYVQVGLTKEWVMRHNLGYKYDINDYHKEYILNYFAGQQLSKKDFCELDYRGLYEKYAH